MRLLLSLSISALILVVYGPVARAQQSDETAKVEIGIHFSYLISRGIQPQSFERSGAV